MKPVSQRFKGVGGGKEERLNWRRWWRWNALRRQMDPNEWNFFLLDMKNGVLILRDASRMDRNNTFPLTPTGNEKVVEG